MNHAVKHATDQSIKTIRERLLDSVHEGRIIIVDRGAIAELIAEYDDHILNLVNSRENAWAHEMWGRADKGVLSASLLDDYEGLTAANWSTYVTPAWQEAHEREVARRKRTHGGGELAVAVLVNPKHKYPVLAVADGGEVTIYIPRKVYEHAYNTVPGSWELDSGDVWVAVGRGYVDYEDYAANVSGMPRSHTPDGVNPRSVGLGTCLYTALAANENYRDANGISTQPNHSDAAAEWWSKALDRGLVSEIDGKQEFSSEDFTDSINEDDVNRILGDDEIDVTYVDTLEISGTREGPVVTVYEFQTAVDAANLVLLTFFRQKRPKPGNEWASMANPLGPVQYSETSEINVDAISALNVAGYPREFIVMLANLAHDEDPDNEDVRLMLVRHAFDTDSEGMGGKQRSFGGGFDRLERGPYTGRRREESEPVDDSDNDDQLEMFDEGLFANPSRFIGDIHLRPNPDPAHESLLDADDEEIELALDRSEELREKLGWYDLEDLP